MQINPFLSAISTTLSTESLRVQPLAKYASPPWHTRNPPSISINSSECSCHERSIAIFIFTAFAAVGVYLVSGDAKLSFYLALAAHAQLFVGMGTFGFVLGRRMRFKAGKDGLDFDDTAQIVGAEKVAAAAEKKVDQIKQEVQDERG